MELFDSDPVSINALNGRSIEDRQRMAAEYISSDKSPEAIERLREAWGASETEILGIQAACNLAAVIAQWDRGIVDVASPTPEEVERVESGILNHLDSLPAEQVASIILMLSYYAYRFAKESLGE